MGHRYIGSKSKIVDKIVDKIESITKEGDVVCDLMCGTATVSKALKERGFSVIATDVMTYSYHHARVVLLIDKTPTFKKANKFINQKLNKNDNENGYVDVLLYLNNLKPQKKYFYKEFCIEGKPSSGDGPRNYFSPHNASKIDAIRNWIRNAYQEKVINDIEHSLLLNDLILAVNDVANISGTYGHYLSKLTGRANDVLYLKPSIATNFVADSKLSKHNVYKGYAEDLANTIQCSVCYIDPPYMKRQYAANYHILETLAREDDPQAIGVSGLRPWRDQYSNFCTKTKIWDSFDKILTGVKCNSFLISYSEDGLIPIKELLVGLKKYGEVSLEEISHKRFKSNASKLGKNLTEYLIEVKM